MNPPAGLVKIIVDRPMGSFHPEHRDLFYPINYGYIPGMIAPDGDEQDVYILGVDHLINERPPRQAGTGGFFADFLRTYSFRH